MTSHSPAGTSLFSSAIRKGCRKIVEGLTGHGGKSVKYERKARHGRIDNLPQNTATRPEGPENVASNVPRPPLYEQRSDIPMNTRQPSQGNEVLPSYASLTGDVIIAVMGATGTGKSTFVKAVTKQDVAVSDGLRSCTTAVNAVSCPHPEDPRRKLVLVDTPGFDDTGRTDAEVLECLGTWLAENYTRGEKLAGLIYFHRITDIRMTGSALRNLTMFQKLCGERTMSNVALVTTMWDALGSDSIGEEREQELREDFWKSMIALGSKVARHDGSDDSARRIINLFRRTIPSQTLLGEELAGRQLPFIETTAGAHVQQTVARLLADHRRTVEELLSQHAQALEAMNDGWRKEISKEKEKTRVILLELEAAQRKLNRRWWERY